MCLSCQGASVLVVPSSGTCSGLRTGTFCLDHRERDTATYNDSPLCLGLQTWSVGFHTNREQNFSYFNCLAISLHRLGTCCFEAKYSVSWVLLFHANLVGADWGLGS